MRGFCGSMSSRLKCVCVCVCTKGTFVLQVFDFFFVIENCRGGKKRLKFTNHRAVCVVLWTSPFFATLCGSFHFLSIFLSLLFFCYFPHFFFIPTRKCIPCVQKYRKSCFQIEITQVPHCLIEMKMERQKLMFTQNIPFPSPPLFRSEVRYQ